MHLLLCIMVASGQDLVVQYFVFTKAVVHAGMNRRSDISLRGNYSRSELYKCVIMK